MVQPIVERSPAGRVEAPVFRWGAVFAGAFFALGIWVLLWAFGLAVGLSTIDANNPRSVGAATGVWSLIAPLIALFVGGLVAARIAGPVDRTTGALHGAVMWGLTTVAGVLVVGSLMSALVGGVASAGGAMAHGMGMGGTGGSGAGVSTESLLGPINDKLQEQGKPPLTSEQLANTLKSLGPEAFQGGTLNRDALARALSENTRMSREDAQDVAGQIQSGISSAGEGAVKAANVGGKALWGVVAALALGLLASLLGAALGVSTRQRWATATPIGPPV